MTGLPYLASRLYGTPLLIARAKLEVILAVVARKLLGVTLATPPPAVTDAALTAGLQIQRQTKSVKQSDSIKQSDCPLFFYLG